MHTTQVDFQIENIAKNSLTIVINHNSSGIVKERLCAGVIKQIDNQNKKLISVQVHNIFLSDDCKGYFLLGY